MHTCDNTRTRTHTWHDQQVFQIFMVGSPGDLPLFEEAWSRARGAGAGEGKRVSVSEFQMVLNSVQEETSRKGI